MNAGTLTSHGNDDSYASRYADELRAGARRDARPRELRAPHGGARAVRDVGGGGAAWANGGGASGVARGGAHVDGRLCA